MCFFFCHRSIIISFCYSWTSNLLSSPCMNVCWVLTWIATKSCGRTLFNRMTLEYRDLIMLTLVFSANADDCDDCHCERSCCNHYCKQRCCSTCTPPPSCNMLSTSSPPCKCTKLYPSIPPSMTINSPTSHSESPCKIF